jgi:hypothetical protein
MTPTASIQAIKKIRQAEPTNTGSKMQDAEGKASRKSDEIATTPMRGKTAEVTPRAHPYLNESRQTPRRQDKP